MSSLIATIDGDERELTAGTTGSDLYGERERPSVNAALQWAPNGSSVYTAEFYYTGFRGNTFNSLFFNFADWWNALGPNPGETFELYEGTNIIKSRQVGDVYGFNSGDYGTAKTDSYVYAVNGAWDLGNHGQITADLAYQDSTNETSFIAVRTDHAGFRQDIDVDFNAGGGIPSYSFSDPDLHTDPSRWFVRDLFDNANRAEGSAWTFMLDGYYEFDEGFFRRVKAGFRFDDRDTSTFVREQGAGGRIVLTGTESALHGGSAQSFPYAIAKRGTECMVQGLAREGAPADILVNGVRLGFIASGFHQRWHGRTDKDMKERAEMVPLKRGGHPDEAAALMIYLLSGWAGFITGQMLPLIGGDWL